MTIKSWAENTVENEQTTVTTQVILTGSIKKYYDKLQELLNDPANSDRTEIQDCLDMWGFTHINKTLIALPSYFDRLPDLYTEISTIIATYSSKPPVSFQRIIEVLLALRWQFTVINAVTLTEDDPEAAYFNEDDIGTDFRAIKVEIGQIECVYFENDALGLVELLKHINEWSGGDFE